jgi:serine/threonine protein kinase
MILFITTKNAILHLLFLKLTELLLLQLQSGSPLDEMSIACILRDLLHAIEYLHNEGKIHRDIKGILLFSEYPYSRNSEKFSKLTLFLKIWYI